MQDPYLDKDILITGATGSIGSEIVRQLLATGASKIRLYSRDEHKQNELKQALPQDPRLSFLLGDVRDKDRLEYAFQGVDICFHAAALKHLPFCEYNPFEALKTNTIGTQNVIDVSIKNNLEKVVGISTDKAVNPESVLGASKLMMERLLIAANVSSGPARTRFSVVRFGNVLNSRGSVADIWHKQIGAGGPLTLTDNRMRRYFMEIPEAVQLVLDATRLMRGGEIFVLKMKKRPLVQFAREFIKKYADGKKIAIKFTGIRPGEKLDEALYTKDEATHMFETKSLYIITPERIVSDVSYPASSYPGARKAALK